MSGILEICPEIGVSPNASKPVDAGPDSSEVATVANSPEVTSFGHDNSLEQLTMTKAQDLLETLQCVLSRENVATDPSLALIMRKDPQACQCNAIGVDQLLEHPAIARIEGITREDLIDALPRMDQKLVRFDAERNWAVPVMVKERDTLVLRLPSEADEEDVNALLKAAPIQGKVHITRQHNLPTVWYCELASAEAATEAALWLREQVICDHKVQVGIKSEPAYATFLSRPLNPPPSMKPAGPNGGRRAMILFNQYRNSNFAPSSPGGRGRGSNRRPNQRNSNGRRPLPKGRGGNRHHPGVQQSEGVTSGNKRLDMSVDFPPLVEGARTRSNGIGYGTESFRQYSPEFLRQVKYKLDGVF